MIITDKFVMVHLPKTGGTFARKAIKKLYEPYFRKIYPQYWLPGKKAVELSFSTIPNRDPSLERKNPKTKHGTYSQIPEQYKHLPVFSIVRNPFDKLLSLYHYKSWQHTLLAPREELELKFPAFPDLTFEEFLDMLFTFGVGRFTYGVQTDFKYGPQTAQFIHFFAKKPAETFRNIHGDFSIKNNPDLFGKVDFLHTEKLNDELYDYLLALGYATKRIAFIKKMDKRNVSEKKEKIILSDETRQLIYEKEKPLFELFPEYFE